MYFRSNSVTFAACTAMLGACAITPGDSAATGDTADAREIAWPEALTTLSQTVIPAARLSESTVLNPAFPEGLAAAEAAGLGGWSEGAGEGWTLRDELAPGSAANEQSRSLAVFVHQSDAQIADCESPTRVAGLDGIGATQAAARPQELHAIHALDAMARRLNELHARVPIDFLVATGDNADSVQANETMWFRDTLDGTAFRPDSGDADQQLDEWGNDPLAPFTPVGLDFPWYAVAGNHDVLVQGNFDPADWVDTALGSDAPAGTRDLSQPGGPLAFSTVPDPERRVLERSDVASIYLDSPATPGPVGHGMDEGNVRDDSVTFAVAPVPGVRLISVDANPDGPTDGLLSAAERDGHLLPALEAAQRAGELIVVTSHYALAELPMSDGGVLGEVLASYPNVVLALAGHWHVNRIAAYGEADDPGAFWEIQTASTTDWPGQARLVEMVVNDDDTLSIYTTMVDYPAPTGSLAARARLLTVIDWQSGWRSESGSGELTDRNTELVQRLPAGLAAALGSGAPRSFSLP